METTEQLQGDIERLLQMRVDGGDDVLTDEESALLAEVFPAEDKPDPNDKFHVNLAEYVEENELNKIATDVLNWVEWDEDSRSKWFEREKKGILLLGVTEETEGGANFDGASKVVHPLLIEACYQFQARAVAELWPPGGPVKADVLGDTTEELEAQARRVERYMNYQYTELMPGAYESVDRMLFRLPLSGSCFKKSYYDPLEEQVVSELIEPNDFIVPYSATSLRTAPRFTHRMRIAGNDMKRMQHSGFYRDVELLEPYSNTDEEQDSEQVRDAIDDSEGRQEVEYAADDNQHIVYECHCYYDLKGFEDKKNGKPTGIALPYIITVERDSQKVLGIRRNWKEKDAKQKKRIFFTHYYFLPGLGFYGYGFLHAIGGLARAATGALRALLDSAQFANLQGGFKSKDVAIEGGKKPLSPGEFRDADATSEELSKAFFRIPYVEPSRTLFMLLGGIDDLARRFAGTTEASVGEANNTGPVGTTLALIEQGQKVFTGVHKRLHVAQRHEFKIVADLNSEWLDGSYPYHVKGGSYVVMATDFDDRVDITPVSDPNITSSVQRIAQAQAILQLANENPDLYDRREAHENLLNAMRVPNVESYLQDRDEARRMGPVEEGTAFFVGKPVKAFIDQNHEAHLVLHQSQLDGMTDEMRKGLIGQAVMAHIQQHMAYQYLIQMEMATGIRFSAHMMDDEESPEIPPEVENQIAVFAAQAVAQMQKPEPGPKAIELSAEQQRKDAQAQAEIARKDKAVEADITRKDMEFIAEQERRLAAEEAALLERNQ